MQKQQMIQQEANKLEQGQKKMPLGYIKDSDYYFDSYSHFSIHEEMLKDAVRTKAYMNSINKNEHLFKDKIVLDVGSGTGVLSIFAARSGAKHVYGIEKANIYLHSRKIIQENGLSDKITIVNGLVEEITLPVEKWMGYFLLYESMLDSVLFARDKWLTADGLMFPNRATMHIAALDDGVYYKKKLNFWDSVYGVSMKCIKKWVLSQPIIDPIEKQDIFSNNVIFKQLDLQTIKKEQLNFKAQFKLQGDYKGNICALVTWFDCFFSHGTIPVLLSTSPYKKSTHWKQCVFYLDTPFNIEQGTVIQGQIDVAKAEKNVRELDVVISYKVEGQQQPKQYYRIS